jgi:2'-5' RNA ligase
VSEHPTLTGASQGAGRSSVRSFVAVQVNGPTRAALAAQIDVLRPEAPSVAWVAPANLHFTLKFLGGVDQALIAPIIEALRGALADAPGFDVHVVGLGAFPTATRPRVVWAGVTVGRSELGALARRVQAAVGPLGFAPEARPFSAHLTLGRVREPRRDARLCALIEGGTRRVFGAFRTDAVSLMKSVLARGGARYSELVRIPLGGSTDLRDLG